MKELFEVIKDNNNPLINEIINKSCEKGKNNELFNSFILWENPKRKNIFEKGIMKINFQSISNETLKIFH